MGNATATVGQRMIRDVLTVKPDDPVRVAVELELQKKIRHFPVVDGAGRLVGVVTDRDLKRALPSPLLSLPDGEREAIIERIPISKVMTKDPMTVAPDLPLAEAVRLLVTKKIGGLPVIENGTLVGIFTATDALRAFLDTLDG